MEKRKTGALLFLLAAACFLAVGIMNYGGRTYVFYGNLITGILFIIVAIRMYGKKRPPEKE